jgi:hypothetical protein
MSRFTRVVIAALVSLGVIVGIYTSAQGMSPKAGTINAQAHVVNGVKTNLDHFRTSSNELDSVETQYDSPSGKGHGCESELQTSPDD